MGLPHALPRGNIPRQPAQRFGQPELSVGGSAEHLGGTLHKRESKRYEITHVPASIRNRSFNIGHGTLLSGCLQLALSSWVFFLTLFAFGVLTAFLLFGSRNAPSL